MSEYFFRPEYWDPLNEKVRAAGSLANSLSDFATHLQVRHGLALKDVLAEFPNFLPAVLGGVSRDGQYGDASLAGLFRSLFGAYVDTRKYCSLKAVPGEDAEAGVDLQVQLSHSDQNRAGPSDFLALLRSAHSAAERALEAWQPGLASTIAQEETGEYFARPMKVFEDIQALLQALADLSIGVDERTTFLYMTRRITWRYMIATFPQVQEPGSLPFLQQKLGINLLWEPDPNPEGGFSLWGYPDYNPWSGDEFRTGVSTGTYGGSILALNRLAWLVFSGQTGPVSTWGDITAAVVGQAPNLPQVFWDRAQGQLGRVRRPECPFGNEPVGGGVIAKGPLAVRYWDPYTSRRGNYNPYREDSEGVPLHMFLDWLIPEVCYAKYELTVEGSNKLGVKRNDVLR